MCRRLMCALSILWILSTASMNTAGAGLVGWWKLDETSGTITNDFRIYNRVLSAAEVRHLAGDR